MVATVAMVAGTVIVGTGPALAQGRPVATRLAPMSNFGCGYYYGNELTVQGNTGARVLQVQCLLSKWDLMDSSQIDGVFGPQTRNAVKDFQETVGLPQDGRVDIKTWARLRCKGGC